MKLKTTAALCIFLISAIILKAQETLPKQPKLFFKIHPVAYLGGSLNLGCEYSLNKHIRITSAIFTYPLKDLIDLKHEHYKTYFFSSSLKGLTLRFGSKFLLPITSKASLYLEPQVRYGLLTKYSNLLTEEYINYDTKDKEKRRQALILLGAQLPIGKRAWIDIHTGIGIIKINGNSAVTESYNSKVSVGNTWNYAHTYRQFYLGTALCFNINTRKSKKG